ncbi:MAG: hypothetical protein JOZ80_11585 [Acidobacteriaceae bacterium]|nr:hypothetical protein [Acidobacteriaceae bacterium]
MAVVVVGGHSRSVGKTSVVAGLISALPEYNWTAFKITQYGHGICSRDGKACHCASDDHTWAISQETDRSGGSDTSRFLVAGAHASWWVRTEQGRLAEAMPRIREKLSAAQNAILESNSILKFIRPDLYLTVLDPRTADFKNSAKQFLGEADAVILHESSGNGSAWAEILLKYLKGPQFRVQPPPYVTAEIASFVKTRLHAVASPANLP